LPELIAAQTGTVYVLQLAGDTLWIGSEKGLFRWDRPRQGIPQRVDVLTGSVNKLYKCGPSLLIAAQGVFIWPNVDARSPIKLDLAVYPVRAFHRVGDVLWIGSDNGLLRWDCESGKQPIFTPKVKVAVTSLDNAGSTLLIGTSRGLLLWNGDEMRDPEQVLVGFEIFSLYKDRSTLLISVTGKGLLRWDNIGEGEPQLVDGTIFFSSKYYRTGSILWLGARTGDRAGLFRWDSQKQERPEFLSSLNFGSVHAFRESEGTLWIGGENGLFRIEGVNSEWIANISITSELPRTIYNDQNLLVQWQVGDFGRRTTPKQAQYQVVITDAEEREVRPGEFTTSGSQEFTLPKLGRGDYALYVQAVDLNNRVARSPSIYFTVYSSSQDLLLRRLKNVGVIYLILIYLAIIFAPYNSFCQSLLMNPWLRRVGSFGLIPIVLSAFPPIRRYILKRYIRAIENDREFSDWQQRLVIPTQEFLPDSFGGLLMDERRILLLGEAGVGKTSYFKYLTGYYSRKKNTPPSGTISVFFPLARYQRESPENIFTAQLAGYGQLSDKELNNWFLQKGGFLIFIDGLNEVDESTRNSISAFVDQYSKTNYFCISSQQAYPEFANLKHVQLGVLTEDKILEFLKSRLSNEQVQTIVKQFGGKIGEIYKIPHDLEFAVEFQKRNPALPIPRSKKELYQATLSPILQSWIQEGRTDYPDLLFHRAYRMLCSGDAFFDNLEVALPDDLRDRLVKEKYLVRRSNHYLFRHDLVRSFLAAEHFTKRWQNLLSKEDLQIDDNWGEMLKFVLLSLEQPDEAKGLLERILVKNSRLAGALFSWLELTVPSLCNGWARDFKIKFADSILISPNL
jgi:GTPase SAR1 family protein